MDPYGSISDCRKRPRYFAVAFLNEWQGNKDKYCEFLAYLVSEYGI